MPGFEEYTNFLESFAEASPLILDAVGYWALVLVIPLAGLILYDLWRFIRRR